MTPRATSGTPWCGRAFGLAVRSCEPIPGLAEDSGAESLRPLTWERTTEATLERRWPSGLERRLLDVRRPDGTVFLAVSYRAGSGYRVEAPTYGTHLVAADGRSIVSVVPPDGTRRWQRLFFAQVLPLAAALSGLELLHASAVELGGKTFALLAASGTGKTSIALHLVASGCRLLTDDVLAIERSHARVRAHAGSVTANVDRDELRSLAPAEFRRFGGAAWGDDDGKLQVDTTGSAPWLPLGATLFLRREGSIPEFSISRDEGGPGVARLLGSVFLPYLRTPERLARHLATCGAIADGIPSYTIAVPRRMSARETAGRLLDAGREHGLWP